MAEFPGPPSRLEKAEKHLRDILSLALEFHPPARALVVYDARSELSELLAHAYRRCLPGAAFLDFDALAPAAVLRAFDGLAPGDLAVLVQSESFRLNEFRIRVELFRRGLKVIEHPHLARMRGGEIDRYVESLAYDPDYYRGTGSALKARIDRAARAEISGGGEALAFTGPFEPAKLNTGDYRGMRNVGGQFPIGEVFTEAKDLAAVRGRLRLFAYADLDYRPALPDKPITIMVEAGRVAGTEDSTPGFERVLAAIRADEGEVWVRELGFGLNRAFGPDRLVDDVGTLERMCGVHLSLGGKHAVYPKPGFGRRAGKHHVDVFAVTEKVLLDGETVFRNGAWTV